jgi:NADH:ubiquinone reductase (non-electrogenic)
MLKCIAQNFHFLCRFESLNTVANEAVDHKRKVVCVVGGGFGGLNTALNIGSRSDCYTDVYLISSKGYFAFSPLLYEMAMGSARPTEVAPLYVDLLTSTKVKFKKSFVEGVDIQSCTVKMNDHIGGESWELKFDKLILAVGIQPRVVFSGGALDHVLPFYTVDNANQLKKELIRLKNEKIGDIKIAVIGGGCGGVEVAANVAENLGAKRSSVTIIDRNDKLMSSSADFNQKTAER